MVTSFYVMCNCCAHAYQGAMGARQYIDHVKGMSYYSAGISQEVVWGLTAKARDFLELPIAYEYGYAPQSVETLGWIYGISFAGCPKSSEYQAWRDENNIK